MASAHLVTVGALCKNNCMDIKAWRLDAKHLIVICGVRVMQLSKYILQGVSIMSTLLFLYTGWFYKLWGYVVSTMKDITSTEC